MKLAGGNPTREDWMESFRAVLTVVNQRVVGVALAPDGYDGDPDGWARSVARDVMVKLHGEPPRPSLYAINRSGWAIAMGDDGTVGLTMKTGVLERSSAGVLGADIMRALQSHEDVAAWDRDFGPGASS